MSGRVINADPLKKKKKIDLQQSASATREKQC